MQWIEIESSHELPKDGTVFLSLWKGRICLTQYDVDEGRFYVVFEPAEYSQCMQIAQLRENKFSHWMKLPLYPFESEDEFKCTCSWPEDYHPLKDKSKCINKGDK